MLNGCILFRSCGRLYPILTFQCTIHASSFSIDHVPAHPFLADRTIRFDTVAIRYIQSNAENDFISQFSPPFWPWPVTLGWAKMFATPRIASWQVGTKGGTTKEKGETERALSSFNPLLIINHQRALLPVLCSGHNISKLS